MDGNSNVTMIGYKLMISEGKPTDFLMIYIQYKWPHKEERKNFLSEWTVLFSSDDFQVLPPYHPTTANEDDRRKMVKKRLTSKYYIKSAFRGDGSSSNGALRRGDGE